MELYVNGSSVLNFCSLHKDLTLYQNNKIVDLSKLKDFADYNVKVIQNIKNVFDRTDNIVG